MLLSQYYKLVELTVVTVFQASGAVVTVFHVSDAVVTVLKASGAIFTVLQASGAQSYSITSYLCCCYRMTG